MTGKIKSLFLGALCALGLGGPPVLWADEAPVTCAGFRFEETLFTACEIDLTRAQMRLFLRDGAGEIFGSFLNVADSLPESQVLAFAMNGGMYHPDRRPVGLYVEQGQEQMRIITSDGPGNFGLLPNGVFCLNVGKAAVIEARRFEAAPPLCEYATQSGPMLVIDGALHPAFLPDSTSRYIRNGVGVRMEGTSVVAVISDAPVTFHQFARVFQDHFAINNALFLDGNVSRFYAPQLGRADFGLPLGPILGAVVDAQTSLE